MPNWCTNEISIAGEHVEIKKFLDLITDNGFFINVLPDQKDWGCNKDVVRANVHGIDGYQEGDDFLELIIPTDWNPPYGIAQELRRKFLKLTIVWFYREDGQQISGWL